MALAAPAQALTLFDPSREFAMPGPAAFPKYAEMVQRYTAQYQQMTSACTTGAFALCAHIARWADFINRSEGMSGMPLFEAVNTYFNGFDYVTDPSNWQTADYWETPLQFYDVYGDCEDYAISKYFTLRGLGVPAAAMRIVVVMDENLGIQHAILAVNTGSDVVLLDNQISGVVSASRVAHYTPIMSINEVGAWRSR
ncbi:MAG: transglutaminase-like cysteine peptidase [Alphaproteobacteria bacterium]